jgi:two-component system response regulator HydG/two-component system response regulator AtoC
MELRNELPGLVFYVQDNLERVAELSQNERVRAVVFHSEGYPEDEMMERARRLSCERADIEVLIVSVRPDGNVNIQALRSNLTKRLSSRPALRDIAQEILDLIPFVDCQSDRKRALVGHSQNFLRVQELIHRVAPFDMTVLITGETGTGKELVAHAIHRESPRRNEPFVTVNCAAIPETLLESELFGFEKGAFTGALAKQQGKLRSAHRGTIFLDEIGDMPLPTQAKILRALESREIQPLGGKGNIQVDVRVVAATHQNLEQLMEDGRFRSDLYFRLSVLPVRIPPLRERLEDIPDLVDSFIEDLNVRHGRQIMGVTSSGLELLRQQDWPGNVRQLRNIVESAYVACSSRWINASDLRWFHWPPTGFSHLKSRMRSPRFTNSASAPESDRLLEALQATHWNKSKAAELLHWSRVTMYRKIAKYRLSPDSEFQDKAEDEDPGHTMSAAG